MKYHEIDESVKIRCQKTVSETSDFGNLAQKNMRANMEPFYAIGKVKNGTIIFLAYLNVRSVSGMQILRGRVPHEKIPCGTNLAFFHPRFQDLET